MRHKEDFQGYGYQKMWHWAMRSDLPTASSVVTSGEIYFSPFTMDTPCKFQGALGVKGKWDYTVADGTGLFLWSISWYQGVYKRMRGASGSASTFKLIGVNTAAYTGAANVAKTTVYDPSTASSVSTATIDNITDGQLYYANLWVAVASGDANITLNKFENSVSSGTWCYTKSGLTGQSSLPQTITADSATAKLVVEHWIGEA